LSCAAWLLAPAGGLAQQPAPAAPRTEAAPRSPSASAAQPAPRTRPGAITGVVNRVTDGDSLWLQPEGKAPIEVRLRDIDAPEICQAYGPDAKKALEQFALGKAAVLTPSGKDGHGRTVGGVTIDGQSVSKWMVAEGHAWSTRFKYDRGPLMKEERLAIALRRGLHATGEPKMPKEFRKQHGPCK
jgi:endonuclease YncB( thermonuclease family)